jgi:cobalt-zinc-cadmium efflux system membrane fusion protein
MPSSQEAPTILIVDDDEVLGQVLSRALANEGRAFIRAGSVAQALQEAGQHPLRLALLDLCLPDGDGVELADSLRTQHADVPLILMTAYPLRLQEHPEMAGRFTHVLTKPLDLHRLRRAVDEALGERSPAGMSDPAPPVPAAAPDSPHPAPNVPAGSGERDKEPRLPVHSANILKPVALGLVILLMLAGLGCYLLGVPLPGFANPAKDKMSKDASPPALGVALVKDKPHTLEVPEDVRTVLGIRKGRQDLFAVAQPPAMMRPLMLAGSTALDPTRLARIRARFAPCRVVEIGKVPYFSPKNGQTEFRELRPGDRVHKGEVLGVFYSVDVGSKKNDLLDALIQWELDQEILDDYKKKPEAVPKVLWDTQVKAVQGDRNAINRALNNLEVWDIPQDEIDALRTEAKKLSADKDAWFKTREGRWARGEKAQTEGKTDPDGKNENPWGRVTLRAPFDGIIVERNLHIDEMVVDNTVNLFQIADVNRLLIIANVLEDQLPTLEALELDERRWSVRTVGARSAEGLPGTIDEIGYLVDQNDHTVKVKGYVDNPGQRLRAGQYVAATVPLPPPPDVVEIPVEALVDDGRQGLVFVQTDPAKPQYTMRRVQVTHRFDQKVFVRTKPIPKEKKLAAQEAEEGLLPEEALWPGERVLQSGAGELKAALLNLESQPEKNSTEDKR